MTKPRRKSRELSHYIQLSRGFPPRIIIPNTKIDDGNYSEVIFPASKWTELEQSLGSAIAEPIRIRICEILNGYFAAEYDMLNPPPKAKDIMKYIKDVLKHINQLQRVLKGRGIEQRAYLSAKSLIDKELDKLQVKGEPKIIPTYALLQLEQSTRFAIADYEQYIKNGKGFIIGANWDCMILLIARLFKDNGLPIKAPKDASTKTPTQLKKSSAYSPFVMFINELQNIFPEDYTFHAQGLDGLTSAISKATKPIREQKSKKPKRLKPAIAN